MTDDTSHPYVVPISPRQDLVTLPDGTSYVQELPAGELRVTASTPARVAMRRLPTRPDRKLEGFGPDGRWIRSGLPGSTEGMDGIGDLAVFLGASPDGWKQSFVGLLLQLIVKAQATPEKMMRIAISFPQEVHVWLTWMRTSPTPTADQLRAILEEQQFNYADLLDIDDLPSRDNP